MGNVKSIRELASSKTLCRKSKQPYSLLSVSESSSNLSFTTEVTSIDSCPNLRNPTEATSKSLNSKKLNLSSGDHNKNSGRIEKIPTVVIDEGATPEPLQFLKIERKCKTVPNQAKKEASGNRK